MLWRLTRVAMRGEHKNVVMIDVDINKMFDNDRCGGANVKYDSIVAMFPGALTCSDMIRNNDRSCPRINNGNV